MQGSDPLPPARYFSPTSYKIHSWIRVFAQRICVSLQLLISSCKLALRLELGSYMISCAGLFSLMCVGSMRK
jgi:hypothetical protein